MCVEVAHSIKPHKSMLVMTPFNFKHHNSRKIPVDDQERLFYARRNGYSGQFAGVL